ncbi:hypothetical protein EWM64_g10568 [Hericium alpestre]|uniref:FTP domain-containing protein n=1 Tax=Hericium alpestre TaxID=135208 RepID=A0A4Y9ZG99_9AGAM|nr:hypothetical protein EWM64_g10568 [Hericium alpestre]
MRGRGPVSGTAGPIWTHSSITSDATPINPFVGSTHVHNAFLYNHSRSRGPCRLRSGPFSPKRKSLGFGPVHPHAKFHSDLVVVTSNFGTTEDPLEIARSFVTELLGPQLAPENGFAIRKDSYTDKATGVSHVYVRQRVNGVEVADGDINRD